MRSVKHLGVMDRRLWRGEFIRNARFLVEAGHRSFGRPEIRAGAGYHRAPSEGVAKPPRLYVVILRAPGGSLLRYRHLRARRIYSRLPRETLDSAPTQATDPSGAAPISAPWKVQRSGSLRMTASGRRGLATPSQDDCSTSSPNAQTSLGDGLNHPSSCGTDDRHSNDDRPRRRGSGAGRGWRWALRA